MIFSGELGRFGGTASLMQLEKIRLIKAINPSVEIGWDGGVAVDNAYSLVQGGVNVLKRWRRYSEIFRSAHHFLQIATGD